MSRVILILCIFALSANAYGQSLLRSYLLNQADTSVVCTLVIRSYENWDSPRFHYFKRAIATYMLPGDYVVSYKSDTLNLHSEWIHVSKEWININKYILTEKIQLNKMTFVRPKTKPRVDNGEVYLDF